MIHFPSCVTRFLAIRVIVVVALSFSCWALTLSANNISGIVRNGSLGLPSAGDAIVLLRLDDGMQEAHAKTDTSGAFALAVQHPDKRYLVRVIHQDVHYDQQAAAGDALSIVVYDAAKDVRDVAGSIEIIRAGTRGKLLHISDMIEITNQSRPPFTLVGKRTFEAYLPANSKMDSILAAGPDKIGVMISAAPVPGEPGHYALNFPLRPGATKFAFNYDLPYEGHATFETRHAYAMGQLAIMIPPSMEFSSHSGAFQILATGNSRYQVHALNLLKAGEGPAFELSGDGELPVLAEQVPALAQTASPTVRVPSVANPGRVAFASLGRFDPVLNQTHSRAQTFLLAALTAVLFAACVFMVWRARKLGRVSRARMTDV